MFKKPIKFLRELIISFLTVIFILDFGVQHFMVPSSSMYPTMYIGDLFLALKFPYGYTNHSFFLGRFLHDNFGIKLFNGRILQFAKIKRGDIVSWKWDIDSDYKFVLKRVIGIEGDKVEMINGVWYVNDQPLNQTDVGDFSYSDRDDSMINARMFKQTVHGSDKTHNILREDLIGIGRYSNMDPIIVPKNHFFLGGDNIDRSHDSRAYGVIHEDYIIGKAFFRLFSIGLKECRSYSSLITEFHKYILYALKNLKISRSFQFIN